ncbi:MAG: NERD domain-containing protein/DEAD/DEAH box helicase [Proteobacteria bacterium]|nr:NERD domain-containing protein/DEAD/DEAH box helicase [Pseudomonadota bacterium]
MARIVPDGWQNLDTATPSIQRELETLRGLSTTLPDDYTVYHGIHWSTLDRGHAVFGEIDFVVVNRAGDLLLIEQKLGFLGETAEGLVKEYPGKSKSVPVQMARSRDAVLTKLRQRNGASHVHVESLLFCPHYAIKSPLTAGIVPERIVDSKRKDQLAAIIQQVLPIGDEMDTVVVHQFLRDVIKLEPDVSALVGRARTLVARVAEFRAAIDAGRRPLYVCFNRPLADHVEAIAPPGGMACTFHTLCEAVLRAHGQTHDFTQPGAFDALVTRAEQLLVPESLLFDTVIIDEGQDWSERWRDRVFCHARADARRLWLEDPLQNLYGRPAVTLPGWVGLRSQANYRSPRPIVRFLQGLVGEEAGIEAASPIDASDVEFLTYADKTELLAQVKMGIKQCYAAGFKKTDVAVISYHGRESSHVMRHDRLGDFTFRRFSGAYDLFQRPVYEEGDILMESVMRLGQAAPAIVFAEIDFAELDDKAVRRLFVGATRATMKLVLVISEDAAQQLLQRIS